MKFLLAALAAVLAMIWLTPDDATAQSRTTRTKKIYKQQVAHHRRPASVGPNGLCQRDTGTPDSQLNFRNKCDTEEFWNRIMERGSAGQR